MVRIGCNCVRQKLVFRISYIVTKETKRKERGTRSRVEHIRGMKSERSERQGDRPASEEKRRAGRKEKQSSGLFFSLSWGEGVLVSRNNKLEVARHSRLTRIRTAKGTNEEEIASLVTLNPKTSDTTVGES